MKHSEKILRKNLESLSESLQNFIIEAEVDLDWTESKSKDPVISRRGIYLHSRIDPWKEARRQVQDLLDVSEERLCLFFGSGLGYSIQLLLESNNKLTIIWLEPDLGILKAALSISDYSQSLTSGRLRILEPPFGEDEIQNAVQGVSGLTTSFVMHRGSLQIEPKAYQRLRNLAEQIFRKKNVNVSTLARFEKIWTRNLFQNAAEIIGMVPVQRLFGLASGIPIVVCGAGPSLSESLSELKVLREEFILIAVDTSYGILKNSGIDPDIIFSVDPQPLNSHYLEGFSGPSILVMDPTTTYQTSRLARDFSGYVFSSSPFPILKWLCQFCEEPVGEIDFGGSVSTNAVSLAEKMGASSIILLGQDLSFPSEIAHCKGAILEERLNFLENRHFRREMHNYKQMHALPSFWYAGIRGEKIRTNEKLLIFKKWFEQRKKPVPYFNAGKDGLRLEGIQEATLAEIVERQASPKSRSQVAPLLLDASQRPAKWNLAGLKQELKEIILELNEFEIQVRRGKELSEEIYELMDTDNKNPHIGQLLEQMDTIDRSVSAHKGLNEFLGMSIQRQILIVTEGYDANLSLEEKESEHLGIARKSILLYEALEEAAILMKRHFHKFERLVHSFQ